MKEILVKFGVKTKIAKELSCRREHVISCLRGGVETELANKIRELALNKYHGKKI